MRSGKPTVISLFSGCGGSSLGYKRAGFRELLAVDFDKKAVETFKLNFPEVPCWQRDIREVTGREIMGFCGIGKGELDLLDASPPCQGFSTCGKRKVNDERNDLFKEFVRLIKELKPKVFIMENVSGLAKGKMKGLFIEIMRELKSLPYRIKCKLMNAMYYGVPQSRQRLIWIGVRKELRKEPSYPEASNKIITANKAIGREAEFLLGSYANKKWKSGHNRPFPTITNRGISAFSLSVYYDTHGQFLNKEYSMNRALPTITRGNSHHIKIGESKETARMFTIEEALILSSYPKDFKMVGKFKDKWGLIGNSVPPKFMKAVAENIRERILCHAPIS